MDFFRQLFFRDSGVTAGFTQHHFRRSFKNGTREGLPSTILENKNGAGFTLVELIVSVAIFTLINLIVLAKYGQFNSSILLTNLSYEVALSVREAQVYGLGVRETAPGSSNFNASYGVHFSFADTGSFKLFYDLNDNGVYGEGELLENKTITSGNYVKDLCVNTGTGADSCASSGGFSNLQVIFKRPNPEAIINTESASNLFRARVVLSSPAGVDREVVVERTGQISVN